MMDTAPLFSVLIANYNNGRYLMEAVESVYAQSYSNWEIVIVDDGSTDNSKELYKKLDDDSRIHVHYNDKNMGCGYTKHQLVLHANGDYCGFLDPDDVILPDAIKVTMDALMKSQDTVLTFSRHYICDEHMNVMQESRKLVLNVGESYFEHRDYRAEVFAGFKKEAYLRTEGIDINAKTGGDDADLFFKLEEQGGIAILDDFTYKYRIHKGSMTADSDKNFYYNLIVRHNTCLRRGLPVEKFAFKDFKDYIQLKLNIQKSQNEQALSSKAYKLGKLILKPFSIFKRK